VDYDPLDWPEAGFCPEADRSVPFFPDEVFLRVDFLRVDFLPELFLRVDFLPELFLRVDFLRVVPVDALVVDPAG